MVRQLVLVIGCGAAGTCAALAFTARMPQTAAAIVTAGVLGSVLTLAGAALGGGVSLFLTWRESGNP